MNHKNKTTFKRSIRLKSRIKRLVLAGNILLSAAMMTGCGYYGEAQIQYPEPIQTVATTGVTGESTEESVLNGTGGNEVGKVTFTEEELKRYHDLTADWAMKLLNKSYREGEGNVLVSPLSVESAFMLAANGAKGQTLEEILQLFWGENRKPTEEELAFANAFLSMYINGIESSENGEVAVANSIWVNKGMGLTLQKDYERSMKKLFDAEVEAVSFDEKTLEMVNKWCEAHTAGQIKEILSDMSPMDAMYLINAINFDAKWEEPYMPEQVEVGEFTGADGSKMPAKLMSSQERIYLNCKKGYGVERFYENGFAFTALLPNEGVTVKELIESLDGKAWTEMLDNPTYGEVYTKLPKFEINGEYEMRDMLSEMGIGTAFSNEADFSGMINEETSLQIDRVIHKTHIAVDENGTKAAAATALAMRCMALPQQEVFHVDLDRPFVYAIIDTEMNLPIFIGVVEEIN